MIFIIDIRTYKKLCTIIKCKSERMMGIGNLKNMSLINAWNFYLFILLGVKVQ